MHMGENMLTCNTRVARVCVCGLVYSHIAHKCCANTLKCMRVCIRMLTCALEWDLCDARAFKLLVNNTVL